MFKKTVLASVLLLSLASLSAQAAFVETDWKNTNDKLATLDTTTGLEWLDLTQTGGKSINEVKLQLDTLYAGWRMPTYAEMQTLAMNLFPVITNPEANYHGVGVSQQDIGTHTLFGRNVQPYTYGLYERNGSSNILATRDDYNWVYFNYQWANNLDFKRVYEGVYLVSDGGTTLSSINNPQLNINNPNAPVNQVVADVSAPLALGTLGLLLAMCGLRSKALEGDTKHH